MLEGKEFRQIVTALASAGAYLINDKHHIPLADVIAILATFSESGCRAELGSAAGGAAVRIVTPEQEPPALSKKGERNAAP